MSSWRVGVAAAGCVVATAMAMAGAYLPHGVRGAAYIGACAIASFSMFVAYRAVRGRRDAIVLGAAGVFSRLLLVAVPPYTTHDVARYMFDGAVTLSGLDPYVVTNGDPRVLPLHLVWPSAIEHAEYATIYPPLAIAAFSFCALFGPVYAWLVWKSLVALASVAIVWLARHLEPRAFACVALSPLLLFEAGIGAHLDVLCALAVMLAVAARTPFVRGVWIGAGVLCKLTPAFVAVPLVVELWKTSRRSALLMVVGALAVVVSGYVAANQLGYQAVGSLHVFFAKWSFGSPWMLVEDMIEMPRPLLLRIASVVTLVLLVLAAKASWSGARGHALLLAAAAPLVASPVVFPWYLCTLAVLVAYRASPYVLAWLTLMPLTYEVIDRFDVDGSWFPALWPIQSMVASVGLLLILRHREDLLRRAA